MDDGLGWDWVGWDLCVGLSYEHRFAVLINKWQEISVNEVSIMGTISNEENDNNALKQMCTSARDGRCRHLHLHVIKNLINFQ